MDIKNLQETTTEICYIIVYPINMKGICIL